MLTLGMVAQNGGSVDQRTPAKESLELATATYEDGRIRIDRALIDFPDQASGLWQSQRDSYSRLPVIEFQYLGMHTLLSDHRGSYIQIA